MIQELTLFTNSYEETLEAGRQLAKLSAAGDVLLFFGDLGAGKTTLIKGIISALQNISPDEVVSPTFVYLQIYGHAPNAVYHFDLYRLTSPEEFISLGFEEFLRKEALVCIEWPERIAPLFPDNVWRIIVNHLGEDKRSIKVIRP